MSRAKAVADRNARDFYATPATLAEAICCSLPGEPRSIVEPSAGSGSFVRAARARWPEAHVTAVEVDEAHRDALVAAAGGDRVYLCDWRGFVESHLHYDRVPPDLIIGNPPYREAEAHINASLRWLAPGGRLAFLLRLNFLGSAARLDLWQRPGLLSVQTVTPRPSFTNGGTDGTEYAVFVWQKGYTGTAALLPPLVWRTSNRRAA